MREFRPSRCLCRPVLVLGLALSVPSLLIAQQSEFAATRFVPVDTCAVISVNMQSILELMDQDDPLAARFLEASQEATGMDFKRLDRILTMVSSRGSTDPANPPIPSATLMQYRDAVDPASYVVKNEAANSCTFEQTQYNGQNIYVGQYVTPPADGVTSPVLFFPDEHFVIQGDRNMIHQMIDGESAMSEGMDLVNNIDQQAALHFVFEDGSHLVRLLDGAEESMAAGMTDLLNGLERLEVIGDYQRETPLQITIELSTPEQAGQLVGLVNAGRLLVPGFLDGLEEQLNESLVASDNDLQNRSVQAKRDLIDFGRTALSKLDVTTQGNTVCLSLPRWEGLEQLPRLTGQLMGVLILENQWDSPSQPTVRRWVEVD